MNHDEAFEGQKVVVTSLRECWVEPAVVIAVEESPYLLVKLDHRNRNVFRVGVGFVSPR